MIISVRAGGGRAVEAEGKREGKRCSLTVHKKRTDFSKADPNQLKKKMLAFLFDILLCNIHKQLNYHSRVELQSLLAVPGYQMINALAF